MINWRRRSVLTTGAAFAAGSVLSSAVSGDGEGDDEQLPDPDIDPNPETDAVWPSFDGDAGHARYAADAPEFDGEALEAAWTFERATGEAAVVDDVVYASSSDGIVALDAADGSTIWEYTDVDANRPSVVDDTVYVVEDELYALDAADGDVRWQTELEPEDSSGTQTVAYGSAFVVADGTLYALDTDDGSVRWERESITAETQESDSEEAEFEFRTTTAAANGVVYALAADDDGGARLALDPETGDEVWQAEYTHHDDFGIPRARATTTAVTLGGESYYARDVLDARTGEELGHGPSQAEGIELVLGEEIYIGGYYGDALTATAISGDADGWGVDVLRNVNDAAAIGGDTVYVYINDNAGTGDTTDADDIDHSEYHDELVALNRYDGSERWTISTDELPIGHVVAIDDETLYVEDDDHEGEGLVALREQTDEGDDGDEDEDGDGDEDEQDDGSEEDDSGDEQDEDGEDPNDDDQGELENDDEDEGEADDDEEPDGDDQEDDDEGESSDDGNEEDDGDEDDEQYGGEEGDEDEAESDDGVGDADENGNVGEDEDNETGDDDPNGDDASENEDESAEEDDEDDGVDTDEDDDTDTETDDEADSVPGFTTGAGIAGGALGLEWLRRRATADSSTRSTSEQAESVDESEN